MTDELNELVIRLQTQDFLIDILKQYHGARRFSITFSFHLCFRGENKSVQVCRIFWFFPKRARLAKFAKWYIKIGSTFFSKNKYSYEHFIISVICNKNDQNYLFVSTYVYILRNLRQYIRSRSCTVIIYVFRRNAYIWKKKTMCDIRWVNLKYFKVEPFNNIITMN